MIGVYDRPRERLFRLGAESLTTPELLALLLGTGTAGATALDLAQAILDHTGGLTSLSGTSAHELACVRGVGAARAARLVAAFHLGRRTLARPSPRQVLQGPEDVYALLCPELAGQDQEVFWVLGLNARNCLISTTEIARGTLTSVEVHPREVFRPLIRHGAFAAVAVHNHPSGDPTPSECDIDLTHRLQAVGELVGVPLVDHVVISTGGYVSLAERGWLGSQTARNAAESPTSGFLPPLTGHS